jgi:5-formyltetrahydrofolate cyclo-ligase
MNQTKQELRQQALRHRQHMQLDGEDPADAIAYFYDLCAPLEGKQVALYWPKTHEFDTTPLILELVRNGVVCGLPVTFNGSRELAFAYWDENTPLERGRYDVQHPQIDETTNWIDPDIVIVPMLAFDQRGYRLGFGGGRSRARPRPAGR